MVWGKLKNRIISFLCFLTFPLLISCSDAVEFSQQLKQAKSTCDPDIFDDCVPPGGGGGGGTTEPPEPPGPPREHIVDASQEFTQQATSNKLDLLIVVDNSDSMSYDHYGHRVENMFRGFMAMLNGVDYHIAVTTTDNKTAFMPGQAEPGWKGTLDTFGNGQKVISSNTPNAEAALLSLLQRDESVPCLRGKHSGACGTNDEEPLKSIMEVVDQRDSINSGFIRGDANFVSIVVSDEDENSGKYADATKAGELIAYLNQNLNGRSYKNYGVIIEPNDSACLSSQRNQALFGLGGGRYGHYIQELATLTGGHTMSICQNSVVNDLRNIGANARQGGLFQQVTVENLPVQGTVQVHFDPMVNIGWSIQGKTITFDSKPPNGTKITVDYKYEVYK